MRDMDAFERIVKRFPESNPQATSFPSGAWMLDLTIGGKRYCAEYLPSYRAFGLSRVEGASPFWEGVDESFKSPEELEARIVELMKNEQRK